MFSVLNAQDAQFFLNPVKQPILICCTACGIRILAVSNTEIMKFLQFSTMGVRGFDFRRSLGNFTLPPALGPTQPATNGTGGSFPRVKRSRREVDSPSSVKVKECVALYLYSPIRLHGLVLS
jgi:hypothetical protein